MPGPRPPLTVDQALALRAQAGARAAILVEGWSDAAALEALARKDGSVLAGEGVLVLPIGGITNLPAFAAALAQAGARLSGLYDAGEEAFVLRGLERIGLIPARTRAEAERAGFFACERDLEDELIRACGAAAVERVLAAQDELASFRRFQAQPAQRGRDTQRQLERFMGTRAGRKVRYGELLVTALAAECVPPALRRVLAHAAA